MNRKTIYSVSAAIVLLSAASMVSAGVVAFDRTGRVMTRWDAFGHILWQSTDISHDAYQMEVGPDGYIYIGMWVDDRVARIDPATGTRVSEIAIQQTPATDRVWDITFGNDWDGDGVADLYTVSGTNKMVLSYGSASGYAGSSEIIFATIAEVTRRTVAIDFGPDVTGDGIADVWVVDGDGNDANNRLFVLNGVTGATVTSWQISEVRGPKDVEVLGGRVYVSSPNAHDIQSYALDGSDPRRDLAGSDSPEFYVRQMQPGFDGKWYTANRFSGAWGGQTGGVTMFDGDWTNGSDYYSASGTDFSGVVSFPDGAYAPVPVDGEKVSDQTDTIRWNNPEPNAPSGVITCDVYLTDNYPESGTDPNESAVDDPNFLNYATKVVDNQAVNTLDLSGTASWPLQYGHTYYWRVDTRDSSSVQSGTRIGKVWSFTVDNSAPQVDAGPTIYTYLTDGSVEVSMAPTVIDDGRPDPPSSYTVQWTLQDGAAEAVTINSPAAENTTLTITQTGTYVFLLTVDDSELTSTDTVTVNVYADACLAAKAVPGYTRRVGDINDDCGVDMADLGLLAADWLESTALD